MDDTLLLPPVPLCPPPLNPTLLPYVPPPKPSLLLPTPHRIPLLNPTADARPSIPRPWQDTTCQGA